MDRFDVKEKIDEYALKVEEHKKLGEEKLPFKSIGAHSGVYQQRSPEKFMIRPRSTGGIIDVNILRDIRDISSKYSGGSVRLSSRQDFQIHGVSLDGTVAAMYELYEKGLYTIGTGGNTARNVAASPLSGLYVGEAFDITPYAVEAGNFLAYDLENLNLPRKFKTSFTSTELDTGSVTFADIGFIARLEDGNRKFKVVGGGGLGPAPRISLELAESIDASDFLYYLDAMKQFFKSEGDRENRAKARLRHLVTKLGEEEFKSRFYRYLEKSRSKDLKFEAREDHKDRNWGSVTMVRSSFIEKTKLKGIYAVYVSPVGGTLSSKLLNELIEFLEKIDYEVEMRLTPDQEIVVRDLGGAEAKALVYILRNHIPDMELSRSVSCVGAGVCRTGICKASEVMEEISSHFKRLPLEVRKHGLKIRMSGCPSSCGQHQIGAMSFSGRIAKIDGETQEAFTVYVGGRLRDKDSKGSLAAKNGNILRRDIPRFLEKIAILKKDSGIDEVHDFLESRAKDIDDIILEFSV